MVGSMKKEVGRAFLFFRMRSGMSRRRLAELAGIYHSTIQKIECADRGPSIEMATKLSSAMGVPLSEIIARAEEIASKKK